MVEVAATVAIKTGSRTLESSLSLESSHKIRLSEPEQQSQLPVLKCRRSFTENPHNYQIIFEGVELGFNLALF